MKATLAPTEDSTTCLSVMDTDKLKFIEVISACAGQILTPVQGKVIYRCEADGPEQIQDLKKHFLMLGDSELCLAFYTQALKIISKLEEIGPASYESWLKGKGVETKIGEELWQTWLDENQAMLSRSTKFIDKEYAKPRNQWVYYRLSIDWLQAFLDLQRWYKGERSLKELEKVDEKQQDLARKANMLLFLAWGSHDNCRIPLNNWLQAMVGGKKNFKDWITSLTDEQIQSLNEYRMELAKNASTTAPVLKETASGTEESESESGEIDIESDEPVPPTALIEKELQSITKKIMQLLISTDLPHSRLHMQGHAYETITVDESIDDLCAKKDIDRVTLQDKIGGWDMVLSPVTAIIGGQHRRVNQRSSKEIGPVESPLRAVANNTCQSGESAEAISNDRRNVERSQSMRTGADRSPFTTREHRFLSFRQAQSPPPVPPRSKKNVNLFRSFYSANARNNCVNAKDGHIPTKMEMKPHTSSQVMSETVSGYNLPPSSQRHQTLMNWIRKDYVDPDSSSNATGQTSEEIWSDSNRAVISSEFSSAMEQRRVGAITASKQIRADQGLNASLSTVSKPPIPRPRVQVSSLASRLEGQHSVELKSISRSMPRRISDGVATLRRNPVKYASLQTNTEESFKQGDEAGTDGTLKGSAIVTYV